MEHESGFEPAPAAIQADPSADLHSGVIAGASPAAPGYTDRARTLSCVTWNRSARPANKKPPPRGEGLKRRGRELPTLTTWSGPLESNQLHQLGRLLPDRSARPANCASGNRRRLQSERSAENTPEVRTCQAAGFSPYAPADASNAPRTWATPIACIVRYCRCATIGHPAFVISRLAVSHRSTLRRPLPQ